MDHLTLIFSLFLWLGWALADCSANDPVLSTLQQCHEDAVTFCQSFIEIETSTVTVATVYPTVTLLPEVATHDHSVISSACSALSVRPKIVTVTYTAPAYIVTACSNSSTAEIISTSPSSVLTTEMSIPQASSSAKTFKSSSISSPNTTTPHSNHTSTLSWGNSTASTTPTPTCKPSIILNGVDENGFNPANTPFSATLSCGAFDVANTTALGNFGVLPNSTVTSNAIYFAGLDGAVLLSVLGFTAEGSPYMTSRQLLFGEINMPVQVLGPDGAPAAGAFVQANATTIPGYGQSGLTDANGLFTFTGLPSTTISLIAKTGDNSLAVNGIAASTSKAILQLAPLYKPTGNSTFDASNGTTGWDGGISQTLTKRDLGLVVSTAHQFTVQIAHGSFALHDGATKAYIKFKFVTTEVPGGYFGSKFNDYFSVSIRSDTGAFANYYNSMNSLGLAAFDASGATNWITLTLDLPKGSTFVEYDIGVSNVADNLFDSQVVVAKVGDNKCDGCYKCDDCPDQPMCQSQCQNPVPGSCDFYRNCVEASQPCASDLQSYALQYGDKNCNKFKANIAHFTPAGQKWMFGVMGCLQHALVPLMSKPDCPSCGTIYDTAFDSHPGCYVDNGVCNLPCSDIAELLVVVGWDDLMESKMQMLTTAVKCFPSLVDFTQGCLELKATVDILIVGLGAWGVSSGVAAEAAGLIGRVISGLAKLL